MRKLLRVIKLMLIMVIALNCYLLVSFQTAKGIAVRYLQIINYNSQTYQQLKAELYKNVTPELQKLLFDQDEYKSVSLPPIYYQVNAIKGRITGINHYVFKINWTINKIYSINSVVYIKDGIVYDSHRVGL